MYHSDSLWVFFSVQKVEIFNSLFLIIKFGLIRVLGRRWHKAYLLMLFLNPYFIVQQGVKTSDMQWLKYIHTIILDSFWYNSSIAYLVDLLCIAKSDQVAGRILVCILDSVVLLPSCQAQRTDGIIQDLFEKQSFLSIIMYKIGSHPTLTAWKVASDSAFSCSCLLV